MIILVINACYSCHDPYQVNRDVTFSCKYDIFVYSSLCARRLFIGRLEYSHEWGPVHRGHWHVVRCQLLREEKQEILI